MTVIDGDVVGFSIPTTTTGSYSLYLHVPFCLKKCDYCNFYVIPNKASLHATYLQALKAEWNLKQQLYSLKDLKLVSIYLGGGTPSLLGPQNIAHILSWLPLRDELEITLEVNPENVTLELMQGFKAAGINRISLGVQSFHNPSLSLLSREHSNQQAIEAVLATHQAGIKNISIDLMYDLPTQSLETWESTLTQALALPITHLSLYNLTIEPHTSFFKRRTEISAQMPNELLSQMLLESALTLSASKGWQRYELSAFALPGKHSAHNSGYWSGRPFLGLGPAAYSFWGNARFSNPANLSQWQELALKEQDPRDFIESLEPEALLHEQLLLRLRLLEGFSLADFVEQWGALPEKTLRTLKDLQQWELLEWQGEGMRLTPRGSMVYDEIATLLI